LRMIEEKLKAARELIAQRDDIDRQLAILLTGPVPATRKPQKCGNCGKEGHSARTCTDPQQTQ
jgi:hypothetical protein